MDFSNAEPTLVTEPRLLGVLEELRAREPLFHRPELGTTREDFDRQMAPDFFEQGASGRRYSREFVLSMLVDRWSRPHDDPWETSDFHCRELGDAHYALTYSLRQKDRVTRRLTLWRRTEVGWEALYHQGTLVTY
jgi:hypothetical protein